MPSRSSRFGEASARAKAAQDLLEEVGTRVWHFEDGRIVDFKGSHEEFTSQLATA